VNEKRYGKKNYQCNKIDADAKPIRKPTPVEIHLPKSFFEDELIKITIEEYSGLVASATRLRIIERWARAHASYDTIKFGELLILLSNLEDEKG